jgi:phosphoenolpyruvate carboxykinase (ATP)
MDIGTQIKSWLIKSGFSENQRFLYNLAPPDLLESAVQHQEGLFSETGTYVVNTAPYTGRSPKDKYIVDHKDPTIWLGAGTKLLSPSMFKAIKSKVIDYLGDKNIFIKDVHAGAHPKYKISIRVITEYAWQNLFVGNLFLNTETPQNNYAPDYTLISAPGFEAKPGVDQITSKAFIILDLIEHIILIGGTKYAGEIKKSVFTLMNYILPQKDILPLHCSANLGSNDDVALFFGLSGTGKTTLSSDQNRALIGDDEHGWGEDGIFNFEGGCYAKTIKLNLNLEPLVWSAVHRFGAIIENVPLSSRRKPDFDSNEITENTRASYPLEFIDNYVPEGIAGHPNYIFLLTADAFGLLPPLARLSIDQALFYFINGYTSKLAGTEKGLGLAPEATFSPCFAAPFLPLHPRIYAKLLGEKLKSHRTEVWLLNTGWVGGPYGIGQRIPLPYTRAMIDAVLSDELSKTTYINEPFFGLDIPRLISNVPENILFPENSWNNRKDYKEKARVLSDQFDDNYAQFLLD